MFKSTSALHGRSMFQGAAVPVKLHTRKNTALHVKLQAKGSCFTSSYCSGDIRTQSILSQSDYPAYSPGCEINYGTQLRCLAMLASTAYLRDTDDGTLLIIPLSAISMACLISSFLYKETMLDLGWFSRIRSLRRYLLSNFLNLYMRQTSPAS